MSLTIETDLGHDPDDLFAILYLIAAGVDISAIVITPGDPDQIAIAKLMLELVERSDIPVGAFKPDSTKLSSGSVHHVLLSRYGQSKQAKADGRGVDILKATAKAGDDLLVLGPLSNVGAYLSVHSCPWQRAVMQGGFVPYSIYSPSTRLPAFEGKEWMPTFNLNGDRRGAERFLSSSMEISMVGKNVCHTMVFDDSRCSNVHHCTNGAAALFLEAAHLLTGSKRFHDPVAAVCYLHPQVGTWIAGKTIKMDAGWTTTLGEGGPFDAILVDLDRDAFWKHIYSFT